MLTLRSTPDNPVPPGGALKTVRTDDGIELRAAHWRPTTRLVKGTVCLLQGRAEFIEKYVTKGRELVIDGKLVHRNYDDKNGDKKFVTEVVVQEVMLLGSASK